MKEEKLLILKTFMYPSEAYPLMSKLESEGIMCFLDGENTISVHPFLSNAIGGAKLKIRESDGKRANEIIKEIDENFNETVKANEKTIPEKFSRGFVMVGTFCPECDSTNVFRKKMLPHQILLAILLLPLYLPLLFFTKKHFCADCGFEWKQ